jgi:Transposase, Mutator family
MACCSTSSPADLKGDPAGHGPGNSRNGTTAKTVRIDIGETCSEVPRDRAGTFSLVVVPKRQRRIAGFDDTVLPLYAKGTTTDDIADHFAEVYGTYVSRELVGKVTAVVGEMAEWPPGTRHGDRLGPCSRSRRGTGSGTAARPDPVFNIGTMDWSRAIV